MYTNNLRNLKIAATGKLSNYTRTDIANTVARNGGTFTSGINDADYLVVGEKPGYRYWHCPSYVKKISESEFENLRVYGQVTRPRPKLAPKIKVRVQKVIKRSLTDDTIRRLLNDLLFKMDSAAYYEVNSWKYSQLDRDNYFEPLVKIVHNYLDGVKT